MYGVRVQSGKANGACILPKQLREWEGLEDEHASPWANDNLEKH